MLKVHRVRWTVGSPVPPRPWLHCSRCATRRPFVCSGKVRVNAQKKRLDAWLIYRCAACGRTWNLPLHERRAVRSLAPAELAAMTGNDAAFVRRQAFDLERLSLHSDRIEAGVEADIEIEVLEHGGTDPDRLEAEVRLPEAQGLRLDRLVARAAGLPRDLVRRLYQAGALTVRPDGRAPLRQDARDGQVILLDLRALPGRSRAV